MAHEDSAGLGFFLDKQVVVVTKTAFHKLWLVSQMQLFLHRKHLATAGNALVASRLGYRIAFYMALLLKSVWKLQLAQNAGWSGSQRPSTLAPNCFKVHLVRYAHTKLYKANTVWGQHAWRTACFHMNLPDHSVHLQKFSFRCPHNLRKCFLGHIPKTWELPPPIIVFHLWEKAFFVWGSSLTLLTLPHIKTFHRFIFYSF